MLIVEDAYSTPALKVNQRRGEKKLASQCVFFKGTPKTKSCFSPVCGGRGRESNISTSRNGAFKFKFPFP